MAKNASFDKTDLYNQRVKPLVQQLVAECCGLDLPMFVSVCVANSASGTSYQCDSVAQEVCEIGLTNDIFPKFLGVLCGFDIIPPEFSAEEADEVTDKRAALLNIDELNDKEGAEQ